MKCGEQIKFLAFANDVEFLDQENYISVVALIEGWEEIFENLSNIERKNEFCH